MRREGDGQKGNLKDGTEASRPRKDMDRPHGLVDLFIWRLLISHPRLEHIYGLPFFFFLISCIWNNFTRSWRRSMILLILLWIKYPASYRWSTHNLGEKNVSLCQLPKHFCISSDQTLPAFYSVAADGIKYGVMDLVVLLSLSCFIPGGLTKKRLLPIAR
jgi:hypothetical protein